MARSSLARPRYSTPRKHLRPLQGGPWVEDREETRFLWWLVCGGLALCLGSILLGTLLTWWYRLPPGMVPSPRYDPPLLLLFGLTGGSVR